MIFFFLTNPNWKNDIISEYKKYPSLIFFLFKYPGCEKELREYLSKTDTIKKKEIDKFPTFLLLLRIFSDINCYNFQINTKTFLGVEIREEIISCIKSTSNEKFQKAPDINWIGLLMNPSEFNKNFSPKMTYIYSYLEDICSYAFKPDEENKIKYKEIIRKMIHYLFNAIIKGKLDEFFSLQIPDITKKDKKGKELDEMLLYLTNLPEMIQNKFKEESEQKEKELNKKFTEDIKSINDIYGKNKDVYEKLRQAIQEDSKEEIKKRIEYDYTKRKNELESQCASTQGKLNGYMDIIKNIDENKLSLNNYKSEIDNLLKAKSEINKYFNKKKIAHKCFKITLKKELKKFKVIYDKEEDILKKYKINDYFFIKFIKNTKKTLQLKENEKKLSEGKYYKIEEIKFYEIDEISKKKEYDNYKEKIESIEKKEEKDFPLIMIFNKVHKIVIEKKKEDEYSIKDDKKKNLKNLEEIMNGKNSLQNILTKGIDIINNNSFTIDKIKDVIEGLKKIDEKLNSLEFITPKFENQIGTPKETSDFCDKFKNEFKDRIVGRLKYLIEYYDKFISNKYQTKLNIEKFESSFSLVKFGIKRPTINE